MADYYYIRDRRNLSPIIETTGDQTFLLCFLTEEYASNFISDPTSWAADTEPFPTDMTIQGPASEEWLLRYSLDRSYSLDPAQHIDGIRIAGEDEDLDVLVDSTTNCHKGNYLLSLGPISRPLTTNFMVNILTILFTRDIESSSIMLRELSEGKPVVVDFNKYCTHEIRESLDLLGLYLSIEPDHISENED